MIHRAVRVAAASLVLIAASQSQGALLYSNGKTATDPLRGLATGAVSANGIAAPAGTQWSEDQADSSTSWNVILGFANTRSQNQSVADDLSVPASGWHIDTVEVFALQTGASSTISPFSAAYLEIWNGRPGDAGSSVIFGDLTTNRLTTASFTNLYRIPNTNPGGGTADTSRAIWDLGINVNFDLLVGSYWLEWAVDASNGGSAFSPLVTVPGVRGLPGWNGRRFFFGWIDAVDGGPGGAVAQDFPFVINGNPIPEPASLSLVLLGVARLLPSRPDHGIRRRLR